jgi:hypothetical protein
MSDERTEVICVICGHHETACTCTPGPTAWREPRDTKPHDQIVAEHYARVRARFTPAYAALIDAIHRNEPAEVKDRLWAAARAESAR